MWPPCECLHEWCPEMESFASMLMPHRKPGQNKTGAKNKGLKFLQTESLFRFKNRNYITCFENLDLKCPHLLKTMSNEQNWSGSAKITRTTNIKKKTNLKKA